MALLTIIVPAYNECLTIENVVRRIENSTLPLDFSREIIIINDGSTDKTADILEQFKNHHTVIHTKNLGKGGAVRRGFLESHGDYIIVQDADLEQNPEDFPALLKPILDGEADVVFGSRFLGPYKPKTLIMNFHYLTNMFFTHLTNLLSGYRTTDAWTGYKMLSRHALDAILPYLSSNGIEFELETTILLGKRRMRVLDVPISYIPRWYEEGKKTNWKQAVKSLVKLFGFYFRRLP